MTSSWKTLLVVLATAIFALAPAVGAVQPLVLAPAKITVGATVGLLVNGAATAGGLKADLMDSADKVIASVTAPSGSGDAQTVQLAVPSSAPPGSALIKIYKTSAPATAFATHAVTLIKAENMDVSALIIETDKPVYKPGQTVQVRVLSLTSKGLKPRSAKVTLTVKRFYCVSSRARRRRERGGDGEDAHQRRAAAGKIYSRSHRDGRGRRWDRVGI